MHFFTTNPDYRLVASLTLSTVTVFLLFIWQGDIGFSLWDEGFLWYGTQRVILGEVPIRDFMAYDPGRYYWSAALMSIFGDNGIISLRSAVAVFQLLGLFVGLLLIAEAKKGQSILYVLVSAVILATWMFPRHKLFDISLSIISIGALTLLAQNPTSRRYFLLGLTVGLIAVFGRNHGVYGTVGSLGVILWLHLKRNHEPGLIKGTMLWSVGVTMGFSPILLMAYLVPGFAEAFWESIRFLLYEIKATNLPLQTPWPWLVDFTAAQPGATIRGVLIGLFFVSIATFPFVSIAWVVWKKLKNEPVPPILVAASFLALPYAHFVFSRADVSHLAQGIFPLLIGLLAVFSTQAVKLRLVSLFVLCVASIWVMIEYHPGWRCQNRQCVDIEISGDRLTVNPETARDVTLLRDLVARYSPNGESFVATPLWPGAYALLQRRSPMWEIYALFPRSADFERVEIKKLIAAKPRFAVVVDHPLGGRDELRFRNTHPLIYRHIRENFERVPYPSKPAYEIYRAKTGTP